MVSTSLLVFALLLFGLVEGQRKVVRPLPIAPDTKEREKANFDCPEEFGYYPHPSDCTQYYVCVFGGALLESCTGGLMYSHELQTCDWPRNVGCNGLEIVGGAQSSATSAQNGVSQNIRNRDRERTRDKEDVRVDSRVKYSLPPPPQPKAVVTTRGQPRQSQRETLKQQLYSEVEESLPPAEEIENDRQQRVYRGQPSVVGQVQRDRDGYRHTNFLPTYKDRGEKTGVISLGTQYSSSTTTSDLNEILTNDLTTTTKKRRKRSTQNHPSWHVRNHQFRQIFIPRSIPHYALPSNRVEVRYPITQSFINSNILTGPVTSATAHHFDRPEFIRNQQEILPKNSLQSAFSNIVSQTIKPIFNGQEVAGSHTEVVTKGFGEEDLVKDNSSKDQDLKPKASEDDEEIGKNDDEHTEEGQESEFNKESEEGNPKNTNHTTSYEYHSDEPDDEDLGPPPSFFEEKNKYADIVNPFEDPNFDFDRFLEKLGSTTTSSTTSTTTTTTFKPIIIPQVLEESRPVKIANEQEVLEITTRFNDFIVVPREDILDDAEIIRPATPAPEPIVKPVSEDLIDDYDEERGASNKKIYSSKINNPPATTTNSIPEYEYYWEEYEYPESNITETVKPPSRNNNSDVPSVKYSAKYNKEKRNKDDAFKEESTLNIHTTSRYNDSDKIESSSSSVPLNSSENVFTSTSSPTTTTTTTIRTTTTVKTKKTSNRKRTTTTTSTTKAPVQKQKRKPTKTNLFEHDSRQEQSAIVAKSEDKSEAVPQTVSTVPASAKPLNNASTNQYNNIQQNEQNQNNRYDPYYALYDEEAEIYKEVDFVPQNAYNNNNAPVVSTRGNNALTRPAQESTAKRGNVVYNNVNQDIYQQSSTVSDYTDNSYQDEDSAYRQTNKAPASREPQTGTHLLINPGNVLNSHQDPDLEPTGAELHDPQHLITTTPKPTFHYITKSPKSTHQISSANNGNDTATESEQLQLILPPTTYSPPVYFFKAILLNTPGSVLKFVQKNQSKSLTKTPYRYKTLKAIRKLINPLKLNNELLTLNSTKKYELPTSTVTTPTTTITTTTTTRTTTAHILKKEELKKLAPPFFKPKLSTGTPLNISLPPRVSRVNGTIKSLIAGTEERSKSKQRTPSRGRGTSHYTNSVPIVSNEVTVNINRGAPAPRSRPTLKPSTSIVSKASEFIDIYKFPPQRPDPLYPQPQPDKTAAKCRKDVCLLPDCYCGGKEIPGDLPVEQVPQIVLLTFDDSVNDLNKGLYQDLFERGRVNPNGCPIAATFYVSHEWTDYSQVQNLYSDGHELASHTVSHSFGEQFSQKKWTREVAGQREILAAYGGVKMEDVRGMRAPFLSVGGNKMFKMLYDSNFTYDSSMPIYENKPPSWPYTLDYKLFHDCMIPPCPTRSYPGVWEVPMVMWQDLNGGRCSMGDACSNPPDADGVFKMLLKNFQRHYTTNRAPFGLFYHAAWFTQPHHKEGFINFIDTILTMKDVWLVTNWQAIQWVRDPTPISKLNNFKPFQCDYSDRPKRCNNPKVCNLWHKSGVRYMRTCQPCPDIYPWTGNTGIRSSRIDNDIED